MMPLKYSTPAQYIMHPFAELTNKTPSPSQKDDSFSRKHSPWTAARHKKKTRSAQQQQQQHSQQPSDAMPVQQQVISEINDSPVAGVRSLGGSAEFSLADGLSSGSRSTASPHSSPPVAKGSAKDAEVHPSKAYILNPEVPTSPHSMDLGSAEALDLLAGACRTADAPRSPVWFCSNACEDDTAGADQPCAGAGWCSALQPSSSAPTSGNLFDRFGQVAEQRPANDGAAARQHCPAGLMPQQPPELQQGLPEQHRPPQPVLRARRLTARRGSWGSSEQLHRESAATGAGSSQLAAGVCSVAAHSSRGSCLQGAACNRGSRSSSCGWQQICQDVQVQHSSGGWGVDTLTETTISMHCTDTDFQLHSSLGHIDDSSSSERRRSLCGALLQLPTSARAGGLGLAAAAAGCDGAPAAGELAGWEVGTLEWYEASMQEAADEGNLAGAQQLWSSLQATGLTPTRSFMHLFLLCCHYGGSDPVSAQEAVRDMCAAAGFEPDGLTAQLLTAVDVSWQQLQCCI